MFTMFGLHFNISIHIVLLILPFIVVAVPDPYTLFISLDLC